MGVMIKNYLTVEYSLSGKHFHTGSLSSLIRDGRLLSLKRFESADYVLLGAFETEAGVRSCIDSYIKELGLRGYYEGGLYDRERELY